MKSPDKTRLWLIYMKYDTAGNFPIVTATDVPFADYKIAGLQKTSIRAITGRAAARAYIRNVLKRTIGAKAARAAEIRVNKTKKEVHRAGSETPATGSRGRVRDSRPKGRRA